MSRPQIRTTHLSLDVIQPMLDLFGTIQNAHRNLDLANTDLTYASFYRAMHFKTITPEHKDLIEDVWARWKAVFIRPEVPGHQDFRLTDDLRHEDPQWLKSPRKKPGA